MQVSLPKAQHLRILATPWFLQGHNRLFPTRGTHLLEHFWKLKCPSISLVMRCLHIQAKITFNIFHKGVSRNYIYLSRWSWHICRRLRTPPCFAINLQRWFPSSARLISWSIESFKTTSDFLSLRRSTLDCKKHK